MAFMLYYKVEALYKKVEALYKIMFESVGFSRFHE